MCGKLNYSLYGTRDAASNWEECYVEFLKSIGFTQGDSSLCVFHHPVRDISTVVHGDDFTSLARESELNWFKNELKHHTLVSKHRMEKHDIPIIGSQQTA